MAVLLTPPKLQFFDNSGDPLAFGKVYTYAATGGTFSTPKATFTTEAGDVENSNPVVLDSAGRANIWIDGSYDFKVTDANDVQLYTQLAVTAFSAVSSATDAYFESFSGTGSQVAFTTSEDLGTDEKTLLVFVDNTDREYVTNGSFATDTGWTKGSGWTIGSGVATASTASTAISQNAAFTINEKNVYTVTYTITRSAGSVAPSLGGTSGTSRSSSGTFTETIIAGSTQEIAFTGTGFTGTLDNVSIVIADPAGYQVQSTSDFTINGTTLTFVSAPASGTNNIYVFAPSLLVGAASAAAAAADTSAAAALASETQAGVYAGQLTIVSTTSVAIGTGSKVFTVASGLSLNAGQFILITSDANPDTNYMWGQIASYSGTTLTVTVEATGGSGTLADWTMYLTGERGETGATGSISDLSGVPAGTITTSDKVIFDDVDDSNTTKSATIQAIIDLAVSAAQLAMYPIGAYYFSDVSTSPATVLGFGTWSAVQDVMLIGASGTYTAGSTGGSATTTQTSSTLVSHTHTVRARANTTISAGAITVAEVGTDDTTFNSGSTGSGSAMTTISPYRAVYIWRRTA